MLNSTVEMAETPLRRAFVSFSSSDIDYYRTMMMWNANEHIDFNFKDFQIEEKINSKNPAYIRSVCAAKIRRVDTFILLIGNDTWTKAEFVQPEVEAAIEKECRLIGMNLNDVRFKDWLCPWFFANKGALFIPFSSRIGAHALTWNKRPSNPALPDDWSFFDQAYTQLGYQLVGDTAVLPPPPNPFAGGNRPPWAE
jgi:hypothetical protein